MPIEIDMENTENLQETVQNIVNSTIIRITGKGTLMYVIDLIKHYYFK